jgi:hypothetical protein
LHKYRKDLALLFLPPYSPQLAPIERVWKLARRLATHNRYFASLDEVLIAVESCFDQWQKPNPVLRRLCGIIWDAMFSKHNKTAEHATSVLPVFMPTGSTAVSGEAAAAGFTGYTIRYRLTASYSSGTCHATERQVSGQKPPFSDC